MNLELLAAQIAGKVAEARAILEAENPSSDDVAKANALLDEAKALKTQYDTAAGAKRLQAELTQWLTTPTAPAAATVPEAVAETSAKGMATDLKHVTVPGRAMRGRVTSFVDDEIGTKQQKAYAFGQWFMAVYNKGRGKAADWCRENGLGSYLDPVEKSMTEGVDTAGGYLVPDVFRYSLIRIMETYGAARSIFRTIPMTSDTLRLPRRTGGLSAYFVGEGTAPSPSDLSFDLITLTAKKVMALTLYTSELDEDSALDIGDLIAQEIGQAFAYKEDLCVFLGDGTSTYGGITGIVQKFRDSVEEAGGTWTTDAHRLYNPNIHNASGNTFNELVQGDFLPLIGSIVSNADGPDCYWICHRSFYYTVMVKAILAAGGTTASEVINGVTRPLFLSYPVIFSQVMPSTDANSQIACLFGNFNMAAKFGDRRTITIGTSGDYLFPNDMIAVRGSERFAFTCHDVGIASSTPSARVPGPIAALCTLNS